MSRSSHRRKAKANTHSATSIQPGQAPATPSEPVELPLPSTEMAGWKKGVYLVSAALLVYAVLWAVQQQPAWADEVMIDDPVEEQVEEAVELDDTEAEAEVDEGPSFFTKVKAVFSDSSEAVAEMAKAYDAELDAKAEALDARIAEFEETLAVSTAEAELERENAAKVMTKAIEAEQQGQALRDDYRVRIDELKACISDANGG